MKLHGYWRSSTSYRVRIALNVKGVDYRYVPVNLLTGEHRDAAYRAKNPHGTVPMLDTGEVRLTQSLAILDWLEASYARPSFLPKQNVSLCRDLYYAVATELHAPLNPSILKNLFGHDQAAKEAFYQFILHRSFTPIEARLVDHDFEGHALPFGQPTLFEIVLIPQLYNARRWNVALDDFPILRKIDAHCQTLEAFSKARPENQIDATQG